MTEDLITRLEHAAERTAWQGPQDFDILELYPLLREAIETIRRLTEERNNASERGLKFMWERDVLAQQLREAQEALRECDEYFSGSPYATDSGHEREMVRRVLAKQLRPGRGERVEEIAERADPK